MKDYGSGFIVGFLTAAAITVLFVWPIVSSFTDDSWRRQIAEHGCAHYYLDANNDRQWDWTK